MVTLTGEEGYRKDLIVSISTTSRRVNRNGDRLVYIFVIGLPILLTVLLSCFMFWANRQKGAEEKTKAMMEAKAQSQVELDCIEIESAVIGNIEKV